MSKFDDLLGDLIAIKDEGVKKATEAYEISKLKFEKMKINQRISDNYERLGEIIYGGRKNNEDVSDVTAVLFEQLDDDFKRIEEIYNEIKDIKIMYGDAEISDDSSDEDYEEYTEYEDDEQDECEETEADEVLEEEEAPIKAKIKSKKNSVAEEE